MIENNFPESPFEPGHHVSPDNFKGRSEDIVKIIRYMPKIINQGIPEHFFITGKRGMGKTSFVKYVANKVEQDFHMLPIYLNNDGRDEIDDLIQNIIEETFKVLDKNSKGQKLIETFVGHINEIKVAGVGISLKSKPEIVQNVKNNFQEFLLTIANSLDDINGLFIVIDDINGLSDTPDFANWYKSLSETIDFSEGFVPIAFTLVSYKENFDKLTMHNPSFSRIFHLTNIDHLENSDIERFFIDNFNKYNIEFEDDNSLKQMVYYSWGMPLAMQQIGEECFWNVRNNMIDKKMVLNGILKAAIEIGNKQISLILDQIEDDNYEKILLKLGKNRLIKFKKSHLTAILNDDENKIIDNFLTRMIELNILEYVGKKLKEEYTFTNRLYFVYFLIIANIE